MVKCLNRVYSVQNSVPCTLNMMYSCMIWKCIHNTHESLKHFQKHNNLYVYFCHGYLFFYSTLFNIYYSLQMFHMLFIHSSIIVYYQINLFSIVLTHYVVISIVKTYCMLFKILFIISLSFLLFHDLIIIQLNLSD